MGNKQFIERHLQDRPLRPFWLEKELLSLNECVYIYYNIEPIQKHETSLRIRSIDEREVIEVFDSKGFLHLLKGSSLYKKYRDEIPIIEFVKWLQERDYSIPSHFSTAALIKQASSQKKKTNRRPDEEIDDKRTIIVVAKTLLDIFPEISVSKLVESLPIQDYANGKDYIKATLMKWVKPIFPNRKRGNVKNDIQLQSNPDCLSTWFKKK